MELKIRIKTPKGAATGTEKKVRGWLLPVGVTPIINTNADDSEIIWTVITDVRRAFKIQRNVTRFEFVVEKIIGNRIFKKFAHKKVGDKGITELENMLYEQTKVEIIKD